MGMRITDIGRLQLPTTRLVATGLSAGAAFALPPAPAQTARVAMSAPMNGLRPLVLPDREAQRKRSIGQGRAVMDGFDQLKLALLSGMPVMPQLRQLAGTLDSMTSGDDPVLDDLLESIRLRAEVEIAKAGGAGAAPNTATRA